MNTQLPENVEPSINCLEEAAAMDPSFVAPHCYLCFQYYFMGYSGMMPLKQAYALSSASQNGPWRSIRRMIRHCWQAVSSISLMNSTGLQEKVLEQSLEKNPNNLFALMMLCWYHAIFLEYDKAIEVAEKCFSLIL